ncbi:pathogenesis-related protein STH-2-like [Olea europaea var. sylvestris]|uniref:pathogenesis-related protein STH-2-like n=1 Tax=Olea europaea var. sylvestris TaxID=158386 RepID=UPI000C1CFD8D|nr:pathogenesis-related protein STH-2-like [Olea europaea var. sylvestris]
MFSTTPPLYIPCSAAVSCTALHFFSIVIHLTFQLFKVNMGISNYFHELKTNVSHKRLFKALITDNHDVLPKVSPSIKSIETIEGDGGAGSVKKTNFSESEGSHFKHMKTKVDSLDKENYVAKFTLVEGDALGDELEKVCYEMKFEDSKDGGCVLKITSEYHSKGDVVPKEEDIKAAQEHTMGLYKSCADYLIANPHVCV